MAQIEAQDRQARILSLIRSRGFVSNEALAQQFKVAVQTIRRDLDRLESEGRLLRYHGGAGLPSSIENISYADRQVLNPTEKDAIAAMVAAEVPDHASLFLNIGTTTEAVARALAGHTGLRVVTNNLNVAALLTRMAKFEVSIVGGRVRSSDGGVVGSAATDMIDQYRVDYGIIGISGVGEDGALLDFDADEVRAARSILRIARVRFLVADHTKFARRPMVRLGSITEVSAVFTDRPPPERIARMLADNDVALHVPMRENEHRSALANIK